MVEVKKNILLEFIQNGFFNGGKDIHQVIKKLSQHGYTISGKKIGRIAQTLTLICRDRNVGLEREELPKNEWKNRGRWLYKKVK